MTCRQILLAFLISTIAQGTSIICGLTNPPPCTRLRPGKAIFLADVPHRIPPSGAKVTLAVTEVLYGLPPETRTVQISWFALNPGLNIIDAERDSDGSLIPSVCGATGLAASNDLLRFLRSRAAGDEPTSISVTLSARDARRPNGRFWRLPNTELEIAGSGFTYRAISDQQGVAHFRAVQPGKYTVSPASPGVRVLPTPYDGVEVMDRACATSTLSVAVESSIRGVVIGPGAIAAGGMTVELRSVDFPEVRFPLNVPLDRLEDFREKTDATGRFEFRHIPPGQYYLGTNLLKGFGSSPFPRIYYPCGFDRSCAEVFDVTPGFDREIRFTIPSTVVPRSIRFRVIDLDGKPVAGAEISELGYRHPDLSAKEFGMLSIKAVTDAAGVVQATGYEGVSYQVRARLQVGGSLYQFHPQGGPVFISDIVDIPAGKGPMELTLTVRNDRLRR